jgi:hypothetical protein
VNAPLELVPGEALTGVTATTANKAWISSAVFLPSLLSTIKQPTVTQRSQDDKLLLGDIVT